MAFSTFCTEVEKEKRELEACDIGNRAYWDSCLVGGIFHLMSDRSRPDRAQLAQLVSSNLPEQWEYARESTSLAVLEWERM